MPIGLFTQKNFKLEKGLEIAPLPGVGQFIIVVHGCAFIICVPVLDIEEAGTLRAFLEEDNVNKKLMKRPCFLATPKTSIWVPFGYETCIVGVDLKCDEEEKDPDLADWLSYTTIFSLQPEEDGKGDAEVRLHVASQCQGTLAKKIPWLEKAKGRISEWKSKVESV